MFYNRPPVVLPPIVSPTKQFNVHDTEVFQVPHIHPSHTTFHHHKLFEHVHTCPHTCSHVCDVCHQHVNCCPDPMAGGMMGAGMGMAPGMMAGPRPY
ncbi:MAG TPA: spore coat protein CotH [Bacillus bacterium]|nr:spore coat protein CotH [Bacillus sp. (in: firmicutes)]